MNIEHWKVIEDFQPGFFGKEKDEIVQGLDRQFGQGRWRIAWRLANGEIQDYGQHFDANFVNGYVLALENDLAKAREIASKYAYGYDKDLITRAEAFDPNAYYNRPGFVDQIHHVGFNIALERVLKIPFTGDRPLQIRSGKPGTDPNTWPEGWKWSPGRIMAPRPDLIPKVNVTRKWHWEDGSIEDMYQRAKILQILKV